MEKLRIVIIGSGQISRVTHIPNLRNVSEAEIVGISDVNAEAARQLADETNIPSWYSDHKLMLEELKPDAAFICVPNRFHCRITLDALEAGCHVFCEKPPAMSVEEAEQMERVAKEKGLILTYGFHFRHALGTKLLKNAIDQGKLGSIYFSKIRWTRKRGIPGWGNFTNKAMQGGGPLIDIGAHMLDVSAYLLGYPKIDTVLATMSDRIGKRGGDGFFGSWDGAKYSVEDGLFGFIRFADGSSLEIETSFALNQKQKNEREVLLYGDLGGANLFPPEIYSEENGQLCELDFPDLPEHDWHIDADKNFVHACLGKEEILVTAEQGTYVQKIIEALYRSAEFGMPVKVN